MFKPIVSYCLLARICEVRRISRENLVITGTEKRVDIPKYIVPIVEIFAMLLINKASYEVQFSVSSARAGID